MTRAYLGLGSNLGDRELYLRNARQALALSFPGARFSSVYETQPMERVGQPWFLNQAVEIETELPPIGLLEWIRDLEKRNGRQRLVSKGPRTLDVDILLFGDLIIETPELQVPHSAMTRRRFVLVPLAELAGSTLIPSVLWTVDEALRRLNDNSQVRLYPGGTATC